MAELSFKDKGEVEDFAREKGITCALQLARPDGSLVWDFFSPKDEEALQSKRTRVVDIEGTVIVDFVDLR